MEDRRPGGLAGRSRRAQKRRCSDRRQSQQLIDEYLDTDVESCSVRPIPIRGRSDFLPTIATCVMSETSSKNAQLELPLEHASHAPTHWVEGRESDDLLYANVEPQADPEDRQNSEASAQPHRVAHFEMFEFSRRRKNDSFSIKRFLYGCLVGGGAAAAVLLILRIAL